MTILALYALLSRCALVPRALVGLGVAAAALMIVAVGMPFFGHDVAFALLAPMAVSQLLLGLWLLTRGNRRRV